MHDLLEQLEDETIEMSVLEATLASLGEGCADGQSNDNVVGVLGSPIVAVSNCCVAVARRVFLQRRYTASGGRHVRNDGLEAFGADVAG